MFVHLWKYLMILSAVLGFLNYNNATGEEVAKNKLQWPPKLSSKQMPLNWETFSPRSEISPQFSYSNKIFRNGKGSLVLYGNDIKYCFGGWRTLVDGIESEKYYAFEGYCKAENIENLREAVTVFFHWKGNVGPEVAPDCVRRLEKTADGWYRFSGILQAPKGAQSVWLELTMKWSARGKVWWDDLRFMEVKKPQPRRVKICTTYLFPKGISPEENVKEFCRIIDRAAELKPDIILLSETITVVNVTTTYQQAAENVPDGPTGRIMSAKAKEHHVNLIYSVNERAGRYIYNTEVLLDREGEMIGKYRKVYIPQEELFGGVSPGEKFPVFDTDIGKIGLMICIDTAFPEAARALALNGAEMIFTPTWGANPVVLRARAIDNGIYIVNAGYDVPSMIINPLGKVLASADKTHGDGLAFTEIDLSKEFRQPWLGNWKNTVTRMRRVKPYRTLQEP
ncbi:MAG: carbon-nitrogen hydrolase family protein [Calditrichaeota bacterium]|nr:carbon-nitrogen hydrolase family protein [Calditrichota bacterium]